MKKPEIGSFISARDVSIKNPKAKILITYLLTLSGILAWLAAIGAAPYFKGRGSILGAFFYSLFAPICHQIPARSFFLFGQPLAVCGRCLGVYTGFFLGSICYPLLASFSKDRIPGRPLLIAASIPIVVDTAGNMLGLWSSSNEVRVFIGMSWGTVLPFYFIPAIASVKWRKGEHP